MKASIVYVNPPEIELYRLYNAGIAIKNSTPSINIQKLKGIRTGLWGFPNALIDIFILLYSL
jgi:hypothetical protein